MIVTAMFTKNASASSGISPTGSSSTSGAETAPKPSIRLIPSTGSGQASVHRGTGSRARSSASSWPRSDRYSLGLTRDEMLENIARSRELGLAFCGEPLAVALPEAGLIALIVSITVCSATL